MRHSAVRVVLLGILILAVALRFYRLDAQSFWNDEGNSARIAERPLPLVLEGAEGDIHPPGYYLLLRGWRALAGQSEFALRALSVFAGVGMVLATFLLGREVFTPASGVSAAFLAAIAPLGIYYSQEARMYTLLGLLATVSTVLLLRVLLRPWTTAGQSSLSAPAVVSIAGYVLVSAAGLYVHYTFAFVLIAHNVVFVAWWLGIARRGPRGLPSLVTWIGVQAGIGLLFVPWTRIAWAAVRGWSGASLSYRLGPAIVDSIKVLLLGTTVEVRQAGWWLVGQTVLLAAGLVPFGRDRFGRFGIVAVAANVAVLLLFFFVLGLYRPAWLKVLIVGLASAHCLIAHGIEGLARLAARWRATGSAALSWGVRMLGFAAVLAGVGPSLANLYHDPAYARDDYRQVAVDISASARPTDGIVLNAPNQWEVFTYYHPDERVHPAPYHPLPKEAERFVDGLVDRYDRLFVLYWGDAESDPDRRVEAALSRMAYQASTRWYGRVRLATYGVAALPHQPFVSTDAHFGGAVRLLGYAISGGPYAPGDILPLTLFWRTAEPVPQAYKVTVQLLDASGNLAAQRDSEPGAGIRPTTSWEQGETVVDRHGLPLGADTPAGRYTLAVAVYEAGTGTRLPVTMAGADGGDLLVLQALVMSR